MLEAGDCATVFRRFAGPVADELAIVCRLRKGSRDTIRQAEAVYRALAALLNGEQASFGDLASETLYLRDVRRDLPLVLDVRTRLLAEIGQSAAAPIPAFIQQAPADGDANVELAGYAVIPRNREDRSVEDIRATPSCTCEGCVRSGARVIRTGHQTSVYSANVYGVGRDRLEQAGSMFEAAERLVEQCGLGFHDVVRTWIYLRDIDRDYDTLNQARREFFRHRGIEMRPASTGVQGIPFPDGHDFSMSLYAVKAAGPLNITAMSAPTLNEAWSYGADFSRGLRVADANKAVLHLSGTASIDEAGRTVHVGDCGAQVDRMLDNIASLLARQGAGFENVFSAVTYLKSGGDAPLLRSRFRKHGFDGFPCVVVEAPLCRPEFLCETEAVAILPPSATGV